MPEGEFKPPKEVDLKRKDYPVSSLSQYGVSLSDPDKRVADSTKPQDIKEPVRINELRFDPITGKPINNHDNDFDDEPKRRKRKKILSQVAPSDESIGSTEGLNLSWFSSYTEKLADKGVDVLEEVKFLFNCSLAELNAHIGGNFEDLPYEYMDTLLIEGTRSPEVAEILIKKREVYLLNHPEMTRGVPGADEGIITFNGRFINKAMWATATPSEKRSALVGTTCFHYNSGTPGMDDDPDDRF